MSNNKTPAPTAQRPPLYLFGVPGPVGGAATKIAHLIRLLNRDFTITVLPPAAGFLKDRDFRRHTEPFGIGAAILKDLPKKLDGVGIAVCETEIFSSGRAREIKARGLKLVWSNEMMWAFKGEAE